jgi:hypothetical protein
LKEWVIDFPYQVLVDGKVSDVEEHLRAIFKAAIGANSVGESTDIKEGVTFNHHKNVFQAAMKISDQAMVSNNGFNTVLKGQPPSTYPLKNHYIEYTGYPLKKFDYSIQSLKTRLS